jgi:hypothetical protein
MGTFAAAIAAQPVRQMREIARHLRQAKALSRETAAPVRPERRMGQRALRSMVKDGSVVSAGGDLYWLDEAAYKDGRKRRQMRVMVILTLAALAVAAIILATHVLRNGV